jgi:predicted nuclease of predicted toxin-antitoxin system
MIFWVDAQLSPALASWISAQFGVQALALRDLGLRDASDHQIFVAAQQLGVVVISKDRDFVELLERVGPPPQVIWVTCGNTSNANLQSILIVTLPKAIALLQAGENLVEITGRS